MKRIFDIATKDLLEFLRDRKTFLFLLIMPVAFTFLFGFAFGGFSKGQADPRLPIALIDEDHGDLSHELIVLLEKSEVVSLVQDDKQDRAAYEKKLSKGDLAGILVIPVGYTRTLLDGGLLRLTLLTDVTQTAGTTVQNEVIAAANRLMSAVRTAQIAEDVSGAEFDPALGAALTAWLTPPIGIKTTSSVIQVKKPSQQVMSLAHTSPGMMLQFGIAGLLTCAQVIVSERKSRSLQRMLTTATNRAHILLGHYLAIFILIFAQFAILIAFGQLILKVDYLRLPIATLLVTLTTSLCIAAMGLLIGVFAKSEEQAIVFSLVPMFVLSGLGGAWTPLEYTSATFQAIGHFSPVAWAMDGFKNITVQMLGVESVLLPAAALTGYAMLFFVLAIWRFRVSKE